MSLSKYKSSGLKEKLESLDNQKLEKLTKKIKEDIKLGKVEPKKKSKKTK